MRLIPLSSTGPGPPSRPDPGFAGEAWIAGSGGAGATAPAPLGRDGRLAVIRYPPGERACASWFFRRAGGAWALDLTMMQRALRFNHSNYWRFDMSARHPYRFAFDDWAFDRHGFPKRP